MSYLCRIVSCFECHDVSQYVLDVSRTLGGAFCLVLTVALVINVLDVPCPIVLF